MKAAVSFAIPSACVFLALLTSAGAALGLGPFWQEPEIIALDVPAVSDPSGASLLPGADADHWTAVYARSGEIWVQFRTAEGWQAPLQLSETSADSRNPHIAGGDGIHVVWEDDATGHPEVWTRHWDGSSWSPQACLTDDAVVSATPVIAGAEAEALVVWKEGTGGTSAVRCRLWSGGAWGAPETASLGTGGVTDPTVVAYRGYQVAWADYRHGNASIYLRERDPYNSWSEEIRITSLPGSSRYPVLHGEHCCNDYPSPAVTIVFQNDQAGVPEIWQACIGQWVSNTPVRISASNGIPSSRPSVTGFSFLYDNIWWSMSPITLVSWREQSTHPLQQTFCSDLNAAEAPVAGEGASYVSLSILPTQPWAWLGAVWTEVREGTPTLVFRQGSVLSCWVVDIRAPFSILLAPEGDPANTVAALNDCNAVNAPVPGLSTRITFDAELSSHLTWDALQPHPILPEVLTAENGQAVHVIRGGGCWPSGQAWLQMNGLVVRTWNGAVSPDVNGDCVVREDDLDYVESHLGSSDFCADLDGSGSVTASDVAIVESALGDICSQLVGVPPVANTGADMPVRIRITPNPSPGMTAIHLELPRPGLVSARLVDAGGRLVRDFGTSELQAGTTLLSWDGTNDDGRAVASGVYFALVRAEGQLLRRTVLVVR